MKLKGSKENENPKKDYRKPEIKNFGAIKDLTLGGSQNSGETFGNYNPRP